MKQQSNLKLNTSEDFAAYRIERAAALEAKAMRVKDGTLKQALLHAAEGWRKLAENTIAWSRYTGQS